MNGEGIHTVSLSVSRRDAATMDAKIGNFVG